MNSQHELTLAVITAFIWFVFIAYWIFSAIGVKKNVKGGSWARSFGIRFLLIIVLVIIFQSTSLGGALAYRFSYGLQVFGVVLCAAGVVFAIWARRHLGRDWSGTPSIKEGHELVTSGPYRFVRHPIYTGMIVALLGSALVNGAVWVIVFVVASIAFVRRIFIEEGYMMQLFPDQYPEYKKRTKALIPFLW